MILIYSVLLSANVTGKVYTKNFFRFPIWLFKLQDILKKLEFVKSLGSDTIQILDNFNWTEENNWEIFDFVEPKDRWIMLVQHCPACCITSTGVLLL